VAKGLLRGLVPKRMTFEDPFYIAYPRSRPSRAAQTLAQAIVTYQATASAVV
jgi:hypothetical protein